MTVEDLIRDTLNLDSEIEVNDNHGPGLLLGWDSLGHVMIILALEKNYNVSIGIDEVMQIETVADIKSILKEKGFQF